MKAAELNYHISSALDATDRHEAQMVREIARILSTAGDEAAHNFKQHATGYITGAAKETAKQLSEAYPGWAPPHVDEVLPADGLAEKVSGAINKNQDAAVKDFAKAMPACLTKKGGEPQLNIHPGSSSLYKPDLIYGKNNQPVAVDELQGLVSKLDDLKAQGYGVGNPAIKSTVAEIKTMSGFSPAEARSVLKLAKAKPGFVSKGVIKGLKLVDQPSTVVQGMVGNMDVAYLRSLFDELDTLKAQGLTPGRQRKILDEIRVNTGMTPSKARKALEEMERGGIVPVAVPVAKVVRARASKAVKLPSLKAGKLRAMRASSGDFERGNKLLGASVTHSSVVAAKDKIAKDLIARLADNPDWQAYLHSGSTIPGVGSGVRSNYGAVNDLIGNWARTSRNNDILAHALQQAVADEFKLNPAAAVRGEASSVSAGFRVQEEYALNGAAYRAFVRAMYDNTQEQLAQKGITGEITLYRGVLRFPYGDTGVRDILLQPASSFATEARVAAGSFAEEDGAIIAVKVPVERILGTARTGFGCLNEREFVVLGEQSGQDQAWVLSQPGYHVVSAVEGSKGSLSNLAFWDRFYGRVEEEGGNLVSLGASASNGTPVDIDALDGDWIKRGTWDLIDITDAESLCALLARVEMSVEDFKTLDVYKANVSRIDWLAAWTGCDHEPPTLTAAGGCDGVKISWDAKNPYFGKVYKSTAEHIDTITQTTRADVMQVIQKGYDSGSSIPEVAQQIRDTIKGSSLGRAMTIARTEVNRLQNGASLSAAQVVSQATGQGYMKRWLTAPGAEHPRHEDYADLDGQTVGLDELFDLEGNEFAYPGDPDGDPGDGINCRCSMEYVESADAPIGVEVDLSAAGEPDAVLPFQEPIKLEGEMSAQIGNRFVTIKPNIATFTAGTAANANVVYKIFDVETGEELEIASVEETAPDEQLADSGAKCADCGHYASAHAGSDNSGACSMANCDCGGFEEATAEAVEAVVADAIEETIPEEHQPQEQLPPEADTAAPDVEQRTNAAQVPWTAVLAPEGKATDDGRVFAPGSIGHRDLPLSLMAMTETPGEGGHAGAELCGRIDNIYTDTTAKPALVRGEGVFDDSDFGHEIARLVDDGYLTGNSVDLAVTDSKIVMAVDVVDDEGFWLEGVDIGDVEEVSVLDIFFGDIDPHDVLFCVVEAKIGMSTVCPFPAFAEATISLAADGSEQKWSFFQGVLPFLHTVHMDNAIRIRRPDDKLTASAAGMVPVVPPAEWFTNPELDDLTPLTVTDEGKVFGHAWAWGECHIGMQGECVLAPHSNTGYAYYLLKEVETDEGGRVEVGTITLDTNHSGKQLNWRDAAAHYDHTGTAIADVTFGEDEHGGWFSGALRPDASAESVRKFRGATVSGDWRRIHGNLELVGLLTVNVPGFPVPRGVAVTTVTADGGMEILSLIAAGIVTEQAQEPLEITEADKAVLAAFASGEMGELSALAEEARA